MDDIPAVALAVYAHPDDADVAVGGTLARWAKEGASVHLVVCTDGGKGTFDPKVKSKELAAVRSGELQESSALIGLASVTNLGYPDGELYDSDAFRQALVESVRRLRPEVVCGHDPTAMFFGQEYFNHRDHRIAGAAMLDAVAPAAALPWSLGPAAHAASPPTETREGSVIRARSTCTTSPSGICRKRLPSFSKDVTAPVQRNR